MVENCSGRKAGTGRAGTPAGIGEGSAIEAQHRAAAGSRVKRGNLEDAPAQRHQDSVFRPLADGTLTRRGFLMINAAFFGAIAAAGSSQPPDLPLPYFGKFYGNHVVYMNPNNRQLNKTKVGTFFYAPKNGTVDRFRWNRRTNDVPEDTYSGGNGGTYTCQIWPANATTRLPITTGTALSRSDELQPAE